MTYHIVQNTHILDDKWIKVGEALDIPNGIPHGIHSAIMCFAGMTKGKINKNTFLYILFQYGYQDRYEEFLKVFQKYRLLDKSFNVCNWNKYQKPYLHNSAVSAKHSDTIQQDSDHNSAEIQQTKSARNRYDYLMRKAKLNQGLSHEETRELQQLKTRVSDKIQEVSAEIQQDSDEPIRARIEKREEEKKVSKHSEPMDDKIKTILTNFLIVLKSEYGLGVSIKGFKHKQEFITQLSTYFKDMTIDEGIDICKLFWHKKFAELRSRYKDKDITPQLFIEVFCTDFIPQVSNLLQARQKIKDDSKQSEEEELQRQKKYFEIQSRINKNKVNIDLHALNQRIKPRIRDIFIGDPLVNSGSISIHAITHDTIFVSTTDKFANTSRRILEKMTNGKPFFIEYVSPDMSFINHKIEVFCMPDGVGQSEAESMKIVA